MTGAQHKSLVTKQQEKMSTAYHEGGHAIVAHNVKATLLLADGLFHENDIPTGCKYLHGLGSNPLAVARARQAGCSTD